MNKLTSQTRRHMLASALGLLLLVGWQPASAQACTMTAVAPVFGSYLSSGTGSNAAGSVTVSCVVVGALALDVFYTVKLGPGNQAQGTQRRLRSGTSHLSYNVYCDPGHSQIWADGTGGTCVRTGGRQGLLGSLLNVYPVYGRIPGGQFVAPGVYTDLIMVEVLY